MANTGTDPDRFHAAGLPDPLCDCQQAVIVQHKRIATAQQNVADFLIAVQPCADGVEVLIGEREM